MTISTGTSSTATATDAAGNTSEFGSQITTAEGPVRHGVRGREPRRRARRNPGGLVRACPAQVLVWELYDDLGSFLEAAVTDANGTYGFTATLATTYAAGGEQHGTELAHRRHPSLLPVLTYKTTLAPAAGGGRRADHVRRSTCRGRRRADGRRALWLNSATGMHRLA